MCVKCVEAMTEIFPEVPDEEMGDFLICCTAFPFSDGETTREQLLELREKMETTDYRECYGIASEENEADIKALSEEVK